MKRKTSLVIGLLAGVGLALPVLADAGNHGKGPGHGDMGMMRPGQGMGQQGMMGGGMMGDHAGMMEMMMRMHGQMGGMHGAGKGGKWLGALDADKDGQVTREEIESGLKSRLQAHDADGDGALSIDEFEALHSGLIRETMVDRFQEFDANGDGSVTAGEIEDGVRSMSRGHGPMGMMDGSRGDPGMMQPGQGMMQNQPKTGN